MRLGAGIRAITLPLAFVLLWEAVSRLVPAVSPALPPPSRVLADAWQLLASGLLLRQVASSLRRELGGFLAALVVGVPAGIGIALWPVVDDLVDPVVEFLRPIPPIAWIPLGILWFGIGDAQNMFIIFLGAVFPIVLNTIAGVRALDRTLVWGALTLGARPRQVVREIVVPGALPMILTGARIGLGVGWMALVAAELVAARSGLGFMIETGRYAMRTDRVILGMAVIGVIGLLMDRAMRWLERRALPWAEAR